MKYHMNQTKQHPEQRLRPTKTLAPPPPMTITGNRRIFADVKGKSYRVPKKRSNKVSTNDWHILLTTLHLYALLFALWRCSCFFPKIVQTSFTSTIWGFFPFWWSRFDRRSIKCISKRFDYKLPMHTLLCMLFHTQWHRCYVPASQKKS